MKKQQNNLKMSQKKQKKEIEAEIEEFKNKEFMPKVKELLSKWYPKKDKLN